MARVTERLQGDRPLDEFWGLFGDPDRSLEWSTELAGMRDVRGPFDRPGSGYMQVYARRIRMLLTTGPRRR